MARHWTKRDRYTLIQGVSVNGLRWFQTRIGTSYDWPNAPKGRSRDSIYAQARRQYERGGLTRGAYTLRQICGTTGYSASQVRRAQTALGQKWKRTSRTGSHLINEDQMEELIQWLRIDYWCKHLRLYNCLWCGTDDREHYSVGLCHHCYRRYQQRLARGGAPNNRRELLALVRRWLRKLKTAAMADMERQLVKGRALTENMLRCLTRLEAA